MITELTKTQEKLIDTTRNEWLNRFFSCKYRTDRKQAIKYINWLYEFCKYKKPIIIFLDSPLALQIGTNALVDVLSKFDFTKGSEIRSQICNQIYSQIGNQIYSQIGNQIGNQICNQIYNQIYSQIGNQICNQIGNQICNQIYNQIYSQIGNQICNQIYNQIRNQIYNQIGNQIGNQIYNQIGNQIYSQIGNQIYSQIGNQNLRYYSFGWEGSSWYWNWYAYLDYYRKSKLLSKELFQEHNNLVALAKANIYDMILLDGLCVISDMPISIHRNERNRLHSQSGAAIEWPDGYSLYYLNGVHVEKDLFKKIKNDTTTKEDWINQKNLEVRRIIQEQMKERFATEIGGKVVGKHKDPRIGEVIEIDISPDPEKIAHYIHAKDWSTERFYFLRIPPAISDPIEAQRWTYDWNELDDTIMRT